MESKEVGKLQFVNVFPGETMSAEEQRRLHSHAARKAHAKARHLRIMRYQASKTNHVPGTSKRSEERSVVLRISEESVLPSPAGLLASDRRDPFGSFARTFKPIEHFLLDHYVRAVLPYMDKNCNKFNDPARYLDLLSKEWVHLTLTDIGSLNGMFLASCRHLLGTQQRFQNYKELAIQYKLYSVQALREAIAAHTSSRISDSTLAIAILLAYDEIQVGDIPTCRSHLRGLVQMVEHNGGHQTLGLNGFLEHLVRKFVGGLESRE